MKIRDITVLEFNPGTFNYTYAKVTTDEGLVGYGECSLMPGAVDGALRTIRDYLIGQDPARIEQIWSSMYYMWHNVRGGVVFTAAMSGVDVALWDIKGKAAGRPVYDLLGGPFSTRLHCYRGIAATTLEAAVENATKAVRDGWTALKFDPLTTAGFHLSHEQLSAAAAKVGAVREAVGPTVDLMVETHGRLTLALARSFAERIAPFNPLFLEEPVGPEYVESMASLARQTGVPLAAGERLYTRWGFRQLLEKEAVAYVQPDVGHAGGISEVRKIATMAETYGIGVAPHNPFSPLNFVAAAHVDASIPNFFLQETGNFNIPGLLKEPIRIENGVYELPTGPGLGVEVNEDFIAAHPPKPVEAWRHREQAMGRTYTIAGTNDQQARAPN